MDKRVIPLMVIIIIASQLSFIYGAVPDFGENNTALGQVTDDYRNNDYVNATYNVVRNNTLNCMELNYTSSGGAVYENFTEWIENDGLNRLSQTDLRSTFTGLRRNDDDIYLYRDFGVDYFDDFSHSFVLRVSAITQTGRLWRCACWTMSEGLGDVSAMRVANLEFISLHLCNPNIANKFYIELRECINNVMWFANMNNLDVGVTYYITVMRSGTNFTCEAYSDSARLNLIDRQSLILQLAYSYRYLMVPESLHYTFADAITGYVENFSGAVPVSGYDASGVYYTENIMLNTTGGTLVHLTNVTLPVNTGVTTEYSNDNATWRNHLNQVDSDDLEADYYALDMRNLNYTTLYIRFNMTTTDSSVTPRVYQSRIITTYALASLGGMKFYPIIIYGIIVIFLITIGLVLYRKRR